MKSVITLIAGLMFASAVNAKTLLVAQKSPGFEMNPTSLILTLDDSGKITLEKQEFSSGKKSVRKIGQLSKEIVNNIAAGLAAIEPSLQVVDQKAGEPQCTDTPTVIVNNLVTGTEQNMYKSAGCHTWTLPNDEGVDSVNFALFLLRNSN